MKDTNNIVAFIRELYKEPEAFIPLHAPVFNGNEKKYLNACIDSTFVSSVGQFVNDFETKMAEYTNSKYAIVCVNGTSALQTALLLAGVKQGDEVITQSLTFVATCNAINYCGAQPLFIDVDKDTMGLSPKALENYLSKNTYLEDGKCHNLNTKKRISACVPMHTFGHPCRIDAIIEVCDKYNIEVIEDAAESVGSTYKSQHCGTFGKLGVLSFNGNKIITSGGGGMILTDDKELAAKAKHLTTTAKVPHAWEFNHDAIGFNYRMPNINAALGIAQLEVLDTYIENKRKTASAYQAFFESQNISVVTEPQEARSNYWLNAIILKSKEERDSFLQESNAAGVMTRPIWELMNRLPMYNDSPKGDLSNSEWLADRVVNIPSSVRL